MSEMLNVLKTRRSCRKYLAKQVDDEALAKILEAGIYAPSGMNRQAVKLVAIRNAETVAVISKMNAAVMGTDGDPFYGAPCVVVVFADRNVPTFVEDGALAMGNMMNAAADLGVASCWIHRANQVFESEEGRKMAKEWGIPDEYRGIGNCILGYADGELVERERLGERIIYVD